jgi:hypothetical protein
MTRVVKYIEDLPYDDRSQAALIADIVIDIAKAPEIFLRRAHAKIMSQPEAFVERFEHALTEEHYTFIDMLSQWHDELFAKFCEDIDLPPSQNDERRRTQRVIQ